MGRNVGQKPRQPAPQPAHHALAGVAGRGGESAVLASLEQLPEPKTVRGVRKVCAKLHVARSADG